MEPRDVTGERILAELLTARNNSVSQVNVNTSTGTWLCLVFAVVAALCSAFALYEASQAKAETRKIEVMLQGKIQQLENTDNAIRAYINTGRMPPQPEKK